MKNVSENCFCVFLFGLSSCLILYAHFLLTISLCKGEKRELDSIIAVRYQISGVYLTDTGYGIFLLNWTPFFFSFEINSIRLFITYSFQHIPLAILEYFLVKLINVYRHYVDIEFG
jgi:hypothetical protein